VGLDEHCHCQALVPSTHPIEFAVGPLEGYFNGFQLRGVPVGVLCAGYNNIQK